MKVSWRPFVSDLFRATEFPLKLHILRFSKTNYLSLWITAQFKYSTINVTYSHKKVPKVPKEEIWDIGDIIMNFAVDRSSHSGYQVSVYVLWTKNAFSYQYAHK